MSLLDMWQGKPVISDQSLTSPKGSRGWQVISWLLNQNRNYECSGLWLIKTYGWLANIAQTGLSIDLEHLFYTNNKLCFGWITKCANCINAIKARPELIVFVPEWYGRVLLKVSTRDIYIPGEQRSFKPRQFYP